MTSSKKGKYHVTLSLMQLQILHRARTSIEISSCVSQEQLSTRDLCINIELHTLPKQDLQEMSIHPSSRCLHTNIIIRCSQINRIKWIFLIRGQLWKELHAGRRGLSGCGPSTNHNDL